MEEIGAGVEEVAREHEGSRAFIESFFDPLIDADGGAAAVGGRKSRRYDSGEGLPALPRTPAEAVRRIAAVRHSLKPRRVQRALEALPGLGQACRTYSRIAESDQALTPIGTNACMLLEREPANSKPGSHRRSGSHAEAGVGRSQWSGSVIRGYERKPPEAALLAIVTGSRSPVLRGQLAEGVPVWPIVTDITAGWSKRQRTWSGPNCHGPTSGGQPLGPVRLTKGPASVPRGETLTVSARGLDPRAALKRRS